MKGFVKFIAALSITMLLMLMFRALFFTVYKVPNDSLLPQFKSGDRILVNRCSYGLRTGEDTPFGYSRWVQQNVNKGDIVAFNYPISSTNTISGNPVYVGRCDALPGDTVHISSDFQVVVPGKHVIVDVNSKNAVILCNMMRMHEHRSSNVADGKLYVDGRHVTQLRFEKDYFWMSSFNSETVDDSRYYGFVPEDHIIGRVVMLVYSTDAHEPLFKSFRWDRFLKFL